MQFAQDLYHLSEDQPLLLVGVGVGLGHVECHSYFSSHRVLPSGKLSFQIIPEELSLFIFPAFFLVCFAIPYLFPIWIWEEPFQYSKFSQFSSPGAGRHFKVLFLSACYTDKTIVMESQTLNENMSPLEPHFCLVYKTQGKVNKLDDFRL